MDKRVWILGAGFSRSLGGPLLNELLRPEVRNQVEAVFPRGKYPHLKDGWIDVVLRVYAYGRKYYEGHVDGTDRAREGQLLWTDAEQFLDYVDTAVLAGPDSSAYRTLDRLTDLLMKRSQRLSKNDVEWVLQFASAAKRIVAASCSMFLQGADLNSERWDPYVDWARQLTGSDTVITFNYGCVPERLGKHTGKLLIQQIGPSVRPNDKALVLKLHGSVSWRLKRPAGKALKGRSGSEIVTLTPDAEDSALTCAADEIAIASPGPHKKKFSAEWLAPFWEEAERAIQDANAIVFLGYRFPPSDSFARKRLIHAIMRNRDSPYLAMHTVLGVNSPDGPRLTQLLKFALQHREVQGYSHIMPDFNAYGGRRFGTLLVHSLYAEDFLSVYPMGWVTQAWQVRQ
jgi:hypothetical protein